MIIFEQAIKRIFINKVRVLVLLIMPALFIVMFAMQNGSSFTIGIVDNDNTELSKRLINNLKSMDKIKVMELKEKEVYDKAVSYQTEYSLIIEDGFEEKLLNDKNPVVKEFYLEEKEKLFYARAFVDNYLRNIKSIVKSSNSDKVKLSRALEEYESAKLSVINESAKDKEIDQSRLAMGFLVQFMLYMSVITASLIAEDKSSGIFYRVFYAPVSVKRYIAENLAAFSVSALMQVAVILLLIKNIMGFELGRSVMNMYILFIVFALVCVSLGLLIVSLVKKPIFAYAIITLITTPLVMLGGCYWTKDMMPEVMNKIANFIPTTWVMTAVDKLLYQGKGLRDIVFEIFILILFASVFMAGGLFKKVDVSK